jgi:hypothetical protein
MALTEASSADSRAFPARTALAALLIATAAAAVYPVWAVRYPPSLDYPNHLASSYVLAHLHDASLPFHLWYGADWGLYPYLTFDVVLQMLQWFLPIELAGRLYLSLAVIGLPLAMWFFLRQANPRQGSMAFWGLVGTHNIFFLLAYLNFYVSLSFCFLGLGLWLKWLERPRALHWLFAMLGATAIYFSHLLCFGITGIAMTAYCIFLRRPLRQSLLTWAMFVPGALCYLHSSRVIEKQGTGFVFLEFSEKFDNLRGMMHGYSDRLDILTLVVLAVYFVVAWFRNREFEWNRRWLAVGFVLFAAYWVLPWSYGDGSDVDVRVLPILFGVIPAFARIGRRGWWLAPALLLLFFVRVGNLAQNYRSMQPELEGLAGSFRITPMNARVLPIIQSDANSGALHHPFAHFWAYGVIRQHWFSPYLFEIPGVTPLRIREQSYTLDGFWGLDYKETPDWNAIQEDYDYVWSYNAPQYAAGLERIGQLGYSNGKLRMYRIDAPASAPSSEPKIAHAYGAGFRLAMRFTCGRGPDGGRKSCNEGRNRNSARSFGGSSTISAADKRKLRVNSDRKP